MIEVKLVAGFVGFHHGYEREGDWTERLEAIRLEAITTLPLPCREGLGEGFVSKAISMY